MGVIQKILLVCVLIVSAQAQDNATHRVFPNDFQFGAATASFVIEGAWNVSDKSESIWDHLYHYTDFVPDGHMADVACDSYHKYARDVEIVKELGLDFYRFSLSWSRILPSGFSDKISVDGVAYYNNLINLLIENDIKPFITLYHWDLPQSLQTLGGWTNPMMEIYYAEYARVVFETFGDRVKNWLTFNEPFEICQSGYGDAGLAPLVQFSGVGDYLCGHTLLKAHARAYHLYDDVFRPVQNGRIGLSLSGAWYEPEFPESASDQEASDTGHQFTIGWHGHPIFSTEGDYSSILREKVDRRSQEQGFSYSRLPSFTPEEVDYIRGTADFLGLNHYTSVIARSINTTSEFPSPSYDDDRNFIEFQPDSWPSSPASSWLKIVPWGFTKLLLWLKSEYNNPEIIIFENGYSNGGGLEDPDRIEYMHLYMNAMLDAMEQGVNVTGYTVWCLMDNFVAVAGYSVRFGLYQIDHDDPEKPRTPRASAKYYNEIITTKTILRA